MAGTVETVEIDGVTRGIPVPVLYEVPVIWHDGRHGKDRIAAATARSILPLRVVDPARVREAPKPRTRGASIPGTGPGFSGEVTLEGAVWRRWDRGDVPAGRAVVDAFVEKVLNAGRAGHALSLDLPIALTGKRGKAGDVAAPGVVDAGTKWRGDVQAETWAGEYLARHVAFDGSDILLSKAWPFGINPPRQRMTNDRAATVLGVAAELPGADPEIERLSDPVRKALALDRIGALAGPALTAATGDVAKLARAVGARLPSPHDALVLAIASDIERMLGRDAPAADESEEPSAPGMAR